MNENIKYLIDEAITALENRNPDATWHFLRRAKAFADGEPKWVGLTDEEIEKNRHLIDWTAHWSYGTFARAIEAKLREKNTGETK